MARFSFRMESSTVDFAAVTAIWSKQSINPSSKLVNFNPLGHSYENCYLLFIDVEANRLGMYLQKLAIGLPERTKTKNYFVFLLAV